MPIYFNRPQDKAARLVSADFEPPLGQIDYHVQNLFHRFVAAPVVYEDASGYIYWAQPWYVGYFDKTGAQVFVKIPPQTPSSSPQFQLTSGKALMLMLDDGGTLGLSQNINLPTVAVAASPPVAPGQYGLLTTTSIGLVPIAQNTNNAYNLILATRTSHAPANQVLRSPYLNNDCAVSKFTITGTSNQTGTTTKQLGPVVGLSDWPATGGTTDYFFRIYCLNQNAVGLKHGTAVTNLWAVAKAADGLTITYNRGLIANGATANFALVVTW